MTKLVYILGLFLTTSLTVKGQDSTDIILINQTLFEIPQIKNSDYIQLIQNIYPDRLKADFGHYYEKLRTHIDSLTLRQIVDNSLATIVDKGKVWHDNDIAKTKLISSKQVDSLQEVNRDDIKDLQSNLFYMLTLPIYDNSKTYAVINFGGGTARLRMTGAHYLLKKVNGKWTIIATFSAWAT